MFSVPQIKELYIARSHLLGWDGDGNFKFVRSGRLRTLGRRASNTFPVIVIAGWIILFEHTKKENTLP